MSCTGTILLIFKMQQLLVPCESSNAQAHRCPSRGKAGRRLNWIKNRQGRDWENEAPHCPRLEKGTVYYLY